MANTNTVFGARYLQDPWGGSASGKLKPYTVLASDTTPLFVGDFVKLVGGAALSNDQSGKDHPIVTQAAAGDIVVGWVEGFGVDPDNLTKIYRPASILQTAWVHVNPYAFLIIQSTGLGSAADIGKNADIVVAAGSTFTGLSGMQLDHASLSTVNGQLKIVDVDPDPLAEFGAYTKFVCMVNEHAYKVISGV
jgi:hypothetical protein